MPGCKRTAAQAAPAAPKFEIDGAKPFAGTLVRHYAGLCRAWGFEPEAVRALAAAERIDDHFHALERALDRGARPCDE